MLCRQIWYVQLTAGVRFLHAYFKTELKECTGSHILILIWYVYCILLYLLDLSGGNL